MAPTFVTNLRSNQDTPAALPMPADFIPLSTMVNIVRTRNAASIYPPLAATAIANGTLWTVYGLAVAVRRAGG